VNIYLLAYVFWICGLAVNQSVRPKDSQWRLLILFYFLIAIWVMSGSISSFKIWMSPIVFRSAIWLSVPVCLHLHWVMPRPLARTPVVLLWLGYAVFVALSAAEWFLVLPKNSYLFGAALLCVGGLVLLGLHYLFQPAQRWEVRILGMGLMVAVIPILVVNLVGIFVFYPPGGEFSLLTIPALPTAYFYVLSRKKLGNLEIRTNRAISGYIFIILLGMLIFIFLPLLEGQFQAYAFPLFFSMMVALFSGLLAVIAFPIFERWMDRKIFGIKLLPDRLIEEYSSRLSTSLDLNSIAHQLKDEFLPSLLIRQSALLQLKGNDRVSLIYAEGTECSEMPAAAEVDALWAKAGRYIPPPEVDSRPDTFSWVRLILGLQVGGERVGLWLLGRRDPDDFYAQAEISMLQTIANHTASALVNAEQAAQLHALYQANIERHEEERIRLASDLHDEVLNQLAVLSMNMDGSSSPELEENLELVNDRLRRVISGLRPAMLNYGLQAGLEEMVDEISERTNNGIVVRLEIPASPVRYDPRVEGHLYRIIQQATENASSFRGQVIRIYGDLEA
jgi:signal transduction histidine kinase